MSHANIPLMRPEMGDEEIALVNETIRSGWITQGPRVLELEKAFAARSRTAHAVAVSNCTTALHLSLLVLDVGPGDEVIVPPHSYIATANAVLYCGAKPVFIDIDPASAVTSPSFTTSKGIPPHSFCRSKKIRRTRFSKSPSETPRNSDATRTSLFT